MHFDILVEDISGKKALEIIVKKIVGNKATYRIIHYHGIGRIPKDLHKKRDPKNKVLLTNLPKLLRGYGVAFEGLDSEFCLVIVCDLDNKCLKSFRRELLTVLDSCQVKPHAYFCIAVEECEAWLLGDIEAIKKAFPKAKKTVLDAYVNDSICGTWETLANAVYSGGAKALSAKGHRAIGIEKSKWTERICPYLDVENNKSPSFNYFKNKLCSFL